MNKKTKTEKNKAGMGGGGIKAIVKEWELNYTVVRLS